MDKSTYLIILLIAAMFVGAIFFNTPKKYRLRKCTGKDWKTKYPTSANDDIRKYLNTFVNAFVFDRKHNLKFKPSDKLMDIYRHLYPSKWLADSLELETFADDILEQYGVSLEDIWHDELTLGEVFEQVSA